MRGTPCVELCQADIENKLHEDPKLKDRRKMKVKVVTELLFLVLNTTRFQYKGMIYQQKMELLWEAPTRL